MTTKDTLQQTLNRRIMLCGQFRDRSTGQLVSIDEANKKYLTTMCGKNADPKKAGSIIHAAHEEWGGGKGVFGNLVSLDGSPIRNTKMHQLCAARIELINNFIVARPNFRSWFFEEVPLADDEQPYIVNETNNEVGIVHIGEDGTPERQRLVRPQARTPLALRIISSLKVRYKTFDVYRGNVAELTRKTFDIARDLEIKWDIELFHLINQPVANGGAFGPFSFENNRSQPQLRIWVPHSALVVSHFPTTNDYDLTAAAGSATNPTPDQITDNKFNIAIIRAIVDYENRWPDLFEGGKLMATGEIMVPASDIIAIAYAFTPTANVNEQRIQEEINRTGYMSVDYLGRNWKFIPSFFLQSGICYPRFNLMPGLVFSKTGMDREHLETNLTENWEERQMQKVYGAATITQRRIRCMRIKYMSNAASTASEAFPFGASLTEGFPGSNTVTGS